MKSTSTVGFEATEVGESLPVLQKTVTVAQIRAYAEASGDRNPIHLDDAFARSVGLPGVIAHGMLTLAFANQMLTNWLGGNGRLTRLDGRFGGMVVPGDQVTCSGTVAKKDLESRRVRVDLTVTNQRGERVLSKAVAEAEFPKKKE
jgi:acyl dehydratase